MSEPVRNFKQIIRIKGTGDDAYPNPGTLMLWGDNWTLLDWIRQHTDYSKDTRTTPVDVDVLTRLHEYATGIANQNGRHDVRRGEAACIVAGVESVQSYLRRRPWRGTRIRIDSNGLASISPHRRRSLIVSEKIDLQQEALNALKDADLGSNGLRQAFIKGYRAHAYRQPSHVKRGTCCGRHDVMTRPRSHSAKALQSPRPFRFWNTITGCWWERPITAQEVRDGFSTIPVVLDHVYWNWITGTPMHIHLDGVQRIRVMRRQASSKRGKQLSVNQPLTDSEAKKIFINGAEDFYSLSANPQFSNVAELFDAALTEHDRQLLAKTETEAGKRISSELKLEHASDAHARTDPSRAYIQGCKAARSLLEDAIRDMTQEQGTL